MPSLLRVDVGIAGNPIAPQGSIGQFSAYEGSRATDRFEVAFGNELLVGLAYGAAREPERAGQLTRRGNATARDKPTHEYSAAPRFVDLPVDGHGRSGVELNDKRHKWTGQ